MSDHIQVGDARPRVQYAANGIQSAFTFPFPVFGAADLEVWVNATRQSTGLYALSGVGLSAGGTVVFTVPPAAGTVVTLRRRLTIARTSDYQEDGLIRAKVLNDELDYQTAAVQQVAEDAARAVARSPFSASTADLTLPEPQAGKALGWNADGTGLTNDPAEFAATLATVTAQATAASAAAAAAAASQATAGADATAAHSDRLAADAASAASAAAASAAAASAASIAAAKIVWQGAWSAGAAYAARDAVSHGGSSYVCKLGHTNQAPPNATYWDLLASKGDAGAGSGDMLRANNLSDLISPSAARGNLGLAAVASSGAYADLSGKPALGTAAGLNAGSGSGVLLRADGDGSALTGIAAGGAAFKNLLPWGDFTLNPWFRGTSFTNAANGAFIADGWWLDKSSVGTGQLNTARQADGPSYNDFVNAGVTSHYTTAVHSLKLTVASVFNSLNANSYARLRTFLDGPSLAFLNFGSANPRTLTLSFWVKSSVTGYFAAVLGNALGNRKYVSDILVVAANTWERKTITIAGDTTGTWQVLSGIGMYLDIGLYAGANSQVTANAWGTGGTGTSNTVSAWGTTANATFQITLVQVETGSTATAFETLPGEIVEFRNGCRLSNSSGPGLQAFMRADGHWSNPSLSYVGHVDTTSGSAVDFNIQFTSSYDYLFVLDNVLPSASGETLQMLFGTGSTPTYQTSGYEWTLVEGPHSGSTGGGAANAETLRTSLTDGATALWLANTVVFGGAGYGGVSGEVILYNPADANRPFARWDCVHNVTGAYIRRDSGCGARANGSGPVTAARFQWKNASTFAGGRITCLAIKRAP